MDDLVGRTLGRYQIVAQIGEGGMATVYKAYQPGLNRFVALKVLPPIHAKQADFSERFRREAEAIGNLNHPNILAVFDSGQEEGYSFLAMRYVEGSRTLKEVMAERLALPKIVDVVGQIAAALDCAHRQGIIHRDVKPTNVLMDGDWALLSDFGLAKMIEASVQLTGSGVGVGTPAYMSPEQGQGLPVDHRSDIYALGIILFEMLTGRIPHDAETPFAIVVKRVTEPLPLPRSLNPELSEAVEQVLLKALARDPVDRFTSAGAMAEALREAVGTAAAPQVAARSAVVSTASAPAEEVPAAPAPPPGPGTRPGTAPVAASPLAPQALPAAAPLPVAAPLPRARRAFPWKWVAALGLLGAAIVVIVVLAIGLGWFRKTEGLTAGTIRSWEPSGAEMVYVPAGEFWMGSLDSDPAAQADERPRHKLEMEAFWIGRTEVTNAQYAACVADEECSPPAAGWSCDRDSYYGDPAYADYPVVNVTWYQAVEYADWISGRLPTEAEWEYAARGPAGSTYPWGDGLPEDTQLNYNYHYMEADTAPVGSYPQGASWCGAVEMAGNVWEWVSSLYRPYPYDAEDGREDLEAAGNRLVRGGSFGDDEFGVRSAFRHEWPSDEYHCSKGFRVVVDE